MTAEQTVERRLSRDARRAQLLDTAAAMLLDGQAVTMEGLGARAGVSKALPYGHFGNAEDVLAALWDREMEYFTTRIVAAVRAEPNATTRLAVAVNAYFDVIDERGRLLYILDAVGHMAASADPDHARERFVAALLRDAFGIAPKVARGLGSVVVGTLEGAVSAYARRELSRSAARQAVTDVALRLGEANAGRPHG